MPKVTLQDLGNPSEPGEYKVGDLLFQVDRQHLDVWREEPDAAFHLIRCTRANDRSDRFTLGARARV